MAQNSRGKFITIEGIEGVGKSTNMRFIQQYLEEQGKVSVVLTREPGGTEIAEAIRHVLLAHYDESMTFDTELLLMFAARAQHIASVITPNLQAGKWVICDRFTDASYAYQGGGRGVAAERIAQIESWVQGELQPDVTFLLDAPVNVALQRTKRRTSQDRFEVEKYDFFQKVRHSYLERAKQFPQRFRIIDACCPRKKVHEQLARICNSLLTPVTEQEHV